MSTRTRPPLLHLIVCVSLLLSAGCASRNAAEQDDINDPFEPINRGIFAFNDAADKYVLRPVAVGYRWLLPAPIRTGVNNFFDNISSPVDIINALLQGKFRQAASDVGRLAMNTTLGFGGLLDPATDAGLAKNDEDFGQTFGVWGIPEGPYLVVPLFGPRTARSAVGDLANIQVNPQFQMQNSSLRTKINILWIIQTRSTLLGIDQELERAFDRYSFVRDSYLQNRRYLRYDGDLPEEDFFWDDEFDDDEFDDF